VVWYPRTPVVEDRLEFVFDLKPKLSGGGDDVQPQSRVGRAPISHARGFSSSARFAG